MRPVILMTGHTLDDLRPRRGDFHDWFAARVGWPLDRFHVVEAVEPDLPDPRGVDGVLVSGSAASVHDHEPWSVRAGEWLAAAADAGVPILGVCYGHQLLGDTLGGRSERNPNGREIGVVEVTRFADDPLFEGLPPAFPAIATHRDAVTVAPPGARVLAGNANTPIQAMALGPNVRTVQFHPEFDADVIRHYLRSRADAVDAELGPGAAARLLAEVNDVPTGPRILANFFRHWLGVDVG
jgi:GMP synthase (glutamine-hydrolysing)